MLSSTSKCIYIIQHGCNFVTVVPIIICKKLIIKEQLIILFCSEKHENALVYIYIYLWFLHETQWFAFRSMHWNWRSRQPRETDFEAIRHIGGGQNLSQARRFHRIHQFFSISKLDEVEVPLLDVSKFLGQIEEKQPDLYQHLYDCLCGRAGLNCTKGFLYIDEVTPGNVIAPDNKRKGYIVYYTWLELARLRLDLSWIPVSVLRHDDVSKITGGLPRL